MYSSPLAHGHGKYGNPLEVGAQAILGLGVSLQLYGHQYSSTWQGTPHLPACWCGDSKCECLVTTMSITGQQLKAEDNGKQSLDALMHQLLAQHLLEVKVATELDVIQCPVLCLTPTHFQCDQLSTH